MNSPEFNLGSSRQDYRMQRMLRLNFEQHSLLSEEIFHLAETVENSGMLPGAEEHIFEAITSNESARKMDVTSSKKSGKVTSLEIQLYGGVDNNESVLYTYHPDLDKYLKTINYSQNKYVVESSDIIARLPIEIPEIDIPISINALEGSVDFVESVAMTYADSSVLDDGTINSADTKPRRDARVTSKRYEYRDLEDINADMIVRDINGHTKHYIFDVYSHIRKDGHDLLVAINYELEIDSVNDTPIGRMKVEISTKDILTSDQKRQYMSLPPEDGYLYLMTAIKRMHEYSESIADSLGEDGFDASNTGA